MRRTSEVRLRVNGRTVILSRDAETASPDALFLCPAKAGGEVRVQAPNELFSADAVCAAAFSLAAERGAHDRCIVMTECSGYEGVVPVVVEPDAGKATAVLPVPDVEETDEALSVSFPGVTCLVAQNEILIEPVSQPTIFVLRDPKGEMILMRCKVDDRWPELPSSGLAAAAAAIDLARSLPDGVVEYGIGMPGGTAEVGVSKRGGVLAGLSICSTVLLEETV